MRERNKINKNQRIIYLSLQKFCSILNYIETNTHTLLLKGKNVSEGNGGMTKVIKGGEFIKKMNLTTYLSFFIYNKFSGNKMYPFKKRFEYINKIIKYPQFKKVNLCIEMTPNKIIYEYKSNSKPLSTTQTTQKEINKIVSAIKELHSKKYFFSDLRTDNIIIHDEKAYLIDIDTIEPIIEESDKQYDWNLFLNSAKNKKTKKQIEYAIQKNG